MKIAFFSAALLASGATIAATPVDGWYSSIFGGYTYMPDNISITHNGFTRNQARYDSGYHAGGRLGFKSNPLRYEGELTYIAADINKFHLNSLPATGIKGDTSATVAMANIYYDFADFVPAVSPFVGLGLGYAWVDGTLASDNPFGYTRYHGSNTVFAYQATAGLTYNFAENYALNVGYRYVGSERVDDFGKVFQAHLATLGVIYRFNENSYK